MSEIVLVKPEDAELREEIAPVVKRAQELEVVDKSSHGVALQAYSTVNAMTRKVKDLFAEPKTAANAAHKAVCAAEKKLLAPLQEAKRLINGKCSDYEQEQKRQAEERRRKLEAEARKQRDDEIIDRASALEEAGDHAGAQVELANVILEPDPVVSVQPEVAKVEGLSSQTRWKAEVWDAVSLVKYVAENPTWIGVLMPNMPELNRLARSMRENMNIPGVKAVPDTIRVARNTG
jgi:hypothetical protein